MHASLLLAGLGRAQQCTASYTFTDTCTRVNISSWNRGKYIWQPWWSMHLAIAWNCLTRHEKSDNLSVLSKILEDYLKRKTFLSGNSYMSLCLSIGLFFYSNNFWKRYLEHALVWPSSWSSHMQVQVPELFVHLSLFDLLINSNSN